MKDLLDYIRLYAIRGPCVCGRCLDAVDNPESKQPTGHTADVVFFKVSAMDGASGEDLAKLVRQNVQGEFCNIDVFDGKEHNYLELGGWLGDQGEALKLMGLGAVLGLWKLDTPRSLFGKLITEDQVNQLACAGLLQIRV